MPENSHINQIFDASDLDIAQPESQQSFCIHLTWEESGFITINSSSIDSATQTISELIDCGCLNLPEGNPNLASIEIGEIEPATSPPEIICN